MEGNRDQEEHTRCSPARTAMDWTIYCCQHAQIHANRAGTGNVHDCILTTPNGSDAGSSAVATACQVREGPETTHTIQVAGSNNARERTGTPARGKHHLLYLGQVRRGPPRRGGCKEQTFIHKQRYGIRSASF